MQQESDYILREVKRLTVFLLKLIDKTKSYSADEVEISIKETDDFIRKE